MARFRLEKMGHPGTWKRKFDDLQARFQFQTGFHMCIAKTHSINFNCWGGPSMWAEFGAIHAVPWMETVTQRCHIRQGDLAPCAMDDPLVLKELESWKQIAI